MSNRLQSPGFVRAIDEETRRVTVVASTGDIARDGAIIDPHGWDLRMYERNPVVLWAHDDKSLPIARTVESRIEANALVQVHEFGTHPRAEEVYQAVKGGFVNATSVRWDPGETEMRTVGNRSVLVFTRGHQLYETSYVPIPADPGAIVLRADGGAVSPCDFGIVQEPDPVEPVVTTPSLAERLLRGFTRPRLEVGNV